MRRRAGHQPDLFLIVEPPESRLPANQRARVLQLLGELMWSVVESDGAEATPEEASDE